MLSMKSTLSLSLRVVLVSSSILGLATGCGTAAFKNENKKQAAQKDVSASENLQDCLALGNPGAPATPVQTPTYVPPVQNYVPPTQNYVPPTSGKEPTPDYGTQVDTGYDHGDKGGVVIVTPGKDQPTYQPTQPAQPSYQPTQQPTKSPCQAPGYDTKGGKGTTPVQTPAQGPDYYQPIVTKGGEPSYPVQVPVVSTQCGQNGKYCDDGKGGQYPSQTINGQSYNHGDVDACLNSFRNSGYDTKGMWDIQVREERNVSILSGETFTDQGNDHAIVIIKAVNILSNIQYQLLNPNALYCIKSVSVLNDTFISSCMTSNVVYGRDVSVLARANTQLVNCHY